MYQSIALRKACCAIRKMEPLSRALTGKVAWITGAGSGIGGPWMAACHCAKGGWRARRPKMAGSDRGTEPQ